MLCTSAFDADPGQEASSRKFSSVFPHVDYELIFYV